MNKDFRRLAGLTDSRRLTESASDEGIIKKFAKKTKMGEYDVRAIHSALNTIEGGWKLEVKIGTVPMREGSLTDLSREERDAFEKAHGLHYTDFGGYSPTSAALGWMWGTTVPAHIEKGRRKERPTEAEVKATVKAFTDIILAKVIQDKDPKNPVDGKIYINPVGKPKVEEASMGKQYGMDWGDATSLTYTWKFSGVRKAVEVSQLIAPDGDFINLEGSPAGLWTWLYKTDIAAKAQAWLDKNGVAEKDAAKKAMKGYGSNEVVGTCGICNNIQKLRKTDLVLHGYTRPGYGWIQGSCFGVGYKAWELSPESVEAYIDALDKMIPQQKASIASLGKAKSFSILIDDKFLVKGSGQGHRKYTVTANGFDLEDEKKYAYSEVQRMGFPRAYNVHALDAKEAARVFKETREAAVKGAEAKLQQMLEVRQESIKAVAAWKARPLPGAALESTVLPDFRRLSGIKRRE